MDYAYISICKVTCVLFTIFSIAVPVLSELLLREVQNLRTVIVTADIHRDLGSELRPAFAELTPYRNLSALVTCHTLYVVFTT